MGLINPADFIDILVFKTSLVTFLTSIFIAVGNIEAIPEGCEAHTGGSDVPRELLKSESGETQ